MRASSEEPLLPNPFARLGSFWSAQSRLRREFLILLLALGFGLLALPWLIWIAGSMALGSYERGGVLSFIGDFFTALAHGEPAFWLIALGPLAFWLLARLMWLALRRRAG